MKKVLSTRKLSESVAQSVGNKQIVIIEKELIKINNINTDDVRNDVNSIRQGVVVFTSKNAVYAVSKIIEDKNQTCNWQVYCIGGATLKAVKQNFPCAKVVATSDNGELLSKRIKGNVNPVTINFFCGTRRRVGKSQL